MNTIMISIMYYTIYEYQLCQDSGIVGVFFCSKYLYEIKAYLGGLFFFNFFELS
jgi:hypothetical protein